MKKKTCKYFRLLSLCVAAAILFTLLSGVSAFDSPQIINQRLFAQRMERERQSNIEYNALLDSFANDNVKTRVLSSKPLSNDEIMYPDYYAGAYLDDDGELVVLMTEEKAVLENQELVISKTGNQNIITKTAKYSYRHLTDVMNTINTYMEDKTGDKALLASVKTWGLYDDKNCVTVTLQGLTDEKIELFRKEIVDSPAINFEESNGGIELTQTLKPGQRIRSSIGSESIGYRCFRLLSNGTKQYGFVTAAHGAPINSPIYYGTSSSKIGVVTARQFSGSVDASFVHITNENFDISNSIDGTADTLYPGGSLPAVGTYVHKRGYVTGTTSGKVLSTNVSGQDLQTGVTITNLTRTNMKCDHGDSGGIVFSYSGNYTYIAGIVHGKDSADHTYYVKQTSIRNGLNLYPY